ncbi:MAG: SPOR domain-containing protein [Paracoccus sp. (in: a-proteobacteria)]|uniref:SPOR domain-containing protein n=1 Tax=Paracoccus sp. TaxID=267 RepID=UPI0039E5AA0D
MRLWQWAIFWALAPAAALALEVRPAEPPPEGFQAGQYIDSQGCVFLRQGDGWAPRLAGDGGLICGYPPTLSQRGLNGGPRLRVLDPDMGKSRAELLEQALTRSVVTELRPGELVSDPRPMEVLPDLGPEPHAEGPMQDLRAALNAAPAVRQGMGGDLKPNRRLCELLGHDGRAPDDAARLGADPSQGYCGALADADLSRLAFARPLGEIRRDEPVGAAAIPAAIPAADAARQPGPSAAGVGTAQPSPTPPSPAPPVPARPARVVSASIPSSSHGTAAAKGLKADARASRSLVQGRKTETPQHRAAGQGPAPATIPAGARFVLVGHYADPRRAQAIGRQIAGLGFPVVLARNKGGAQAPQSVMAGPFPTREAIVRGLDGIRRAGFKNAVPR